MSALSGRKKHPIWLSFIRIQKGKGFRAKCRTCNAEIQGLVTRMLDHKNKKCTASTESGELQMAEIVDTDNDDHRQPGTSTTSTPEPPNSSDPSTSIGSKRPASQTATQIQPCKQKKCNPSTLTRFVVKTTSAEKDMLDEEVARMVFATNSPFRLVEHEQFKRMVSKMRPGYVPPTRKDVADRLLPLVYEKEKENCVGQIKDKHVSLSLDGWSNVHNEPIICVTVTTDDEKVYLVDTVDTSGNSHTGEYLAELATASINKASKEFGCVVRSVVTDNTGNVTKMRRLLQESAETGSLISYGCSAHLLNLLAHDLEIPNIKEHVVQVVKYFRNNHYASAKYRQEGGRCLVLPQDVRWNTMADCLETYINCWHILMKICESERDQIDVDIRNKITNLGIKRSTEDLLARLKPIAVALDRLQRDRCMIGDAVNVWKELEKELPNVIVVNKKFKDRYNQAMTPAHFLANLLHPSYRGAELSSAERNEAMKYAGDIYPSTVPIIIKFQAMSTPFQSFKFEKAVTDNVSATEWWKSHQQDLSDEQSEAIFSVIGQLFSAVASSAGVERVFSSYGLVQSKLRNRLGTEKASKLVFLFKSMNQSSN